MIARACACALLLIVALGAPSATHAGEDTSGPFTLEDVYRLVSLSSPQSSPDGKHVLVVVRTADREHDRWARRIDLVDAGGGPTRTVARGNVSSPRWSPSGDRFAYLMNGAVWVAQLGNGEARRIEGERVVQFAWRPDGAALAVVALPAPAEKAGDARYLDAYEVGNDPALAKGPPQSARLFLRTLDGASKALGPAKGTVTWGDAESTLSFSPDGKLLAYLWAPNALGNDAVAARMHLVDTTTGREREIPPFGHVRDPLFSPDGRWLAYAYSDGDSQTHPTEAFVVPLAGGAARSVSHNVDRNVLDLAWEPHSGRLDFTAHDGFHTALFRSVDGAPARRIAPAIEIESGLEGAFADDGRLVYVYSNWQRPEDLAQSTVPPPADNGIGLITRYNVAIGVSGLFHGLTFPTSLGIPSDAVVTLPARYYTGDFYHAGGSETLDPPNRHYPLVVVLHGGPTSAALGNFDLFARLLAARGWIVLEPNYRGSDNLGARYQSAVGGDKLRGPGSDIDAAIAGASSAFRVDTSRIAVSGWSYGAGLTLWMIEHRHDFRAAVAGAAVTDIAADYATADDIDADRALVGGSPLVGKHRAAAAAMSPITYVEQVHTPLLLMTARGDDRVSPVGSYEFYHALRDLGRPVKLVAYPVDGHFPSDPVRRVDVYRRWIDFLAAHLGT
ncbi:MAG: S9 family peptidase [Candidatus Eremiobacteraeota bacterium]|nr:S9 family peptidase [Candidatus Eremiobacteraeota bacterium]